MGMPKIECCDVNQYCAAASLVQSIALEEASLSHILNAEGEKIQKAVAMNNCSQKDLIEINRSVENMVEKVTNLEMILKSKLELVLPLLKKCEKCDIKPPKKPEC